MPRKLVPPLALLAGLVMATTLAVATSGSNVSANPQLESEETAFLTLINEYRVQNGLQPLLEQPELNVAAERESSDLATRIPSTFSHTGSDGSSPSQRCVAAGYSNGCGENIAGGFWTAQQVMQGWKDSPGHNGAMLSTAYRVIGISRVTCTPNHAIGVCRYGSYWTTDFGRVIIGTTVGGSSPSSTATPTRSPSPTPRPSATPAATPATTATPAPTPAALQATPTARPVATPRVVHDISITAFTVASEARAGNTKPITFSVMNRGTQSEIASYGLTTTCLDGQPNQVLECGSLQYAGCAGNVSLAPGQKVEIRCSVTYNTATGRDRWRHTVNASIPQDSRPADNSRLIERRVI